MWGINCKQAGKGKLSINSAVIIFNSWLLLCISLQELLSFYLLFFLLPIGDVVEASRLMLCFHTLEAFVLIFSLKLRLRLM